MGFLSFLFTGEFNEKPAATPTSRPASRPASRPISTQRDLDEALAFLSKEKNADLIFGMLFTIMHTNITNEGVTFQECIDRSVYFKEEKYKVEKEKNLKNIHDLDFCRFYVLQCFFSAIALTNHIDEAVVAGAKLDIKKILDACLAHVDPILRPMTLEFKNALIL